MHIQTDTFSPSALLIALAAAFSLSMLSFPMTVSAEPDEEEQEEGQRPPPSSGTDLGSYRVGSPGSSSSLGRMDREQMQMEDMEFEGGGFDRSGFSLEPEFGSSGMTMELDIRPTREEDRSDRRVIDEEPSSTADDIRRGLVENQDLKPLRIEAPRYPTRAYRSNIEGFALVSFVVDEYGETREVRVVDSSPGDIFDRSAKEAVESWRFEPRVVDGRPVSTEVTEVIDFEMDR
ncbi:TonB family protein [Natronospira proteinivora]|uniref:Protein TonB n=1 Tax=Natronospira proteinivora TaxID=1807133 RepID=A0ABT1GBL5_9GAMM|nr:energy transducer TonB [Natronospira proteinivora]MCP1728457.1 TonB family protein [Natronospira proteinivora]